MEAGFSMRNKLRGLHAGGNGKQIFGDTWWLEPEQVTPYDASLLAGLSTASQESAVGLDSAPPLQPGSTGAPDSGACLPVLSARRPQTAVVEHSWCGSRRVTALP
jgi:hypothetical protein